MRVSRLVDEVEGTKLTRGELTSMNVLPRKQPINPVVRRCLLARTLTPEIRFSLMGFAMSAGSIRWSAAVSSH